MPAQQLALQHAAAARRGALQRCCAAAEEQQQEQPAQPQEEQQQAGTAAAKKPKLVSAAWEQVIEWKQEGKTVDITVKSANNSGARPARPPARLLVARMVISCCDASSAWRLRLWPPLPSPHPPACPPSPCCSPLWNPPAGLQVQVGKLQGFLPYKLLDPSRLPERYQDGARPAPASHPELVGTKLRVKVTQVGGWGQGAGWSRGRALQLPLVAVVQILWLCLQLAGQAAARRGADTPPPPPRPVHTARSSFPSGG